MWTRTTDQALRRQKEPGDLTTILMKKFSKNAAGSVRIVGQGVIAG